jgi:protein-S-isoprenylcysteine O-methyltransferase Ste14
MSKKLIHLFSVISLLFSANIVFAQVTIPNPLNGVNTFGDLLLRIAGGVGTVVASIGTIMIIWAGILYLTSAGSPEKMTKAKTALTYAIIGIVVGLAATAIVQIIEQIIRV